MTRDFWVGAGIAGFALFLLAILIPLAVSTPKSVQALVLSPVFWPNILAVMLLIGGAALALLGRRTTEHSLETPSEPNRVYALLLLMPIYVLALPIVGMVWASMVAFIAFLFIVRNNRHIAGILTAILLPLALYAFFYHVAGVAIPQGKFITLP